MTEKSHVGMAYEYCPCCGNEGGSVILLDRGLRKTLTNHMFGGWKVCKECSSHMNNYEMGIVICKNESIKGDMKPEEADREGTIFWIKRKAFEHLFDQDMPVDPKKRFAFAELEVKEQLISIIEKSEAKSEADNGS